MAAESKTDAFGQLNRSEPLHLRVASRIAREIEGGSFKPGDKLPSEHELARVFDVSRNVIREAIACLRSDGVVDSRQGVGAFVTGPEHHQTIRIDSSLLAEADNLKGLFELRSILEIDAAGLAARRRDDAQLANIATALENMSGNEKWSEGGIDADLDFHRSVAIATGNAYIVKFLTFLAQQMRKSIVAARESNPLEDIVETTIDEHKRIYDAIAAGDPDAARSAMRAHISGAATRLGIDPDI
ncbi:FadR/GntR family transcriptional regulator [Oricola sp.]|uniref:FadR/GntR family transcriptional regulator n=1 Tax=Oricola sp. TaxID=1979950 RepID=UPI003BA96284